MALTAERVLYADECLACVNKLPTELVDWNESGELSLAEELTRYLLEGGSANDFVGIVHRLDRPTSGAVLFARSPKCLKRLNELLRKQAVEKTYWAVVDSPPLQPTGTLKHYVLHRKDMNKSYALAEPREGAKQATMTYRLLGESDRYWLLEIDLHTGRHHQIRAQLHRIGCHIKGDLKYGFPRSNKGGGIHLHARRIAFAHPETGERLALTASVPDDPLWQFFARTIDL